MRAVACRTYGHPQLLRACRQLDEPLTFVALQMDAALLKVAPQQPGHQLGLGGVAVGAGAAGSSLAAIAHLAHCALGCQPLLPVYRTHQRRVQTGMHVEVLDVACSSRGCSK
jgi:hypothetical protein